MENNETEARAQKGAPKKARKTVICPQCGYTFTAESPFRAHPPSESTSIFIRAWLLEHKVDHPYSMFRAWCVHLERLQMKVPKLSSFLKLFYCVRRANLVRRTTPPENPVKAKRQSPFKKRNYYELVPKNIKNEELWRNVQVAVYGERMRFGRKQYRKKVLHLSVEPRKRGRPKTRWIPTA